MGSMKRGRSGRKKSNSSHNPTFSRSREEAELARLGKVITTIPRYANRFQLFRQNRRQKAKQQTFNEGDLPQLEEQHAVFRATRFTDLPLSARTLDGLAAAKYTELTGIQKSSIPQALTGRDVLAAAPTGSGKTLAFIVPMLETLWREKWNTMDGLGALILSPTRELSMQIFQVLRSVARMHTISAGLVIGGKDFEGEREKVGNMNILVATPGRLLHHMDHVAELDCSNLKVLILDEADRILDMGFARTLDAILQNLPKKRQTMLFSATQTKNVKTLARLSLLEPEYVAVLSREELDKKAQDGSEVKEKQQHNEQVSIVGTPVGLSQSYTVVPANEKLSVLWSFIKTHLKSKIIVFLSSGKQVRFVFETFCKLRPGMSLLHIHGNMKQLRRTDMYDAFCRTKSAVLFATDVASRGLDFPDVEWVFQLDCPDDVGTYIHRVGRTARFQARGKAMLLLNEGKQESFVNKLEEKKIILHKTKINVGRLTPMDGRISSVVATNQELKNLAQRAFLFYVKSIYQQGDKEVFDVNDLDFEKLSKSFGLSICPRVAFREGVAHVEKERSAKEKMKTVFGYQQRAFNNEKNESEPDEEVETKTQVENENDDEDDILQIKNRLAPSDDEDEEEDEESDTMKETKPGKRKTKKRKLDLFKSLPSANRIVFTEDGKAVKASDIAEDISDVEENATFNDISNYASAVAKRLEKTSSENKEMERTRIQSKHAKQRAKKRELNKVLRPSADALAMMTTGSDQDSDDGNVNSDGETSSSEEQSDSEPDDIRKQEELAMSILQSRK